LISKKWRYGRLHTGAEVQLQISEIDFEHLNVNGSLLVIAENVTGHLNNEGQRIYSEFVGRCVLKNVTIVNKGIDHDFPNVYWKNEIARQESCQIILRGMSEFYAENVTLAGDQFIEVPHGFRCLAFEKGGKVEFIFDKIESPSWSWQYSFTHDYAIEVKNFSHLKSQNL
jgi:hypothetical protein